jgi:hypothetical protein
MVRGRQGGQQQRHDRQQCFCNFYVIHNIHYVFLLVSRIDFQFLHLYTCIHGRGGQQQRQGGQQQRQAWHQKGFYNLYAIRNTHHVFLSVFRIDFQFLHLYTCILVRDDQQQQQGWQ